MFEKCFLPDGTTGVFTPSDIPGRLHTDICYHNLLQYVNRDAAKATPLFPESLLPALEVVVLLAVVLLVLVVVLLVIVLAVLIAVLAVLAILVAVLAIVGIAVLVVVLIVIGHDSFLLFVFSYRSSMSGTFLKYT